MHAQGRSSRFAVSIKTGAAIGLTLLMGACGTRAAETVLRFSADNQRVVTTGQITANDFTAEAWFKLSSYISENQIFSQYRGGDAGRFIVGIKDKVAGMFIGGTWMTGSGTIPLNTWTHIAVSRSNTTWTIYINGQFYTNGVHNANPLASTPFTIGAIGTTGTTAPGFRGDISDVRAWNTVLSQEQIASRLGTRLTGTEAGLAHYWPQNEGLGSTVADLAAGATGTLSIGIAWVVGADLPLSTARQDGTVALWRLDADASGALDTRDFIGNARLSSGLDITAHPTTMLASRNQAFSGQPPNSTLILPNGNIGSVYAQANGACLRVADLGRHLEITNNFTIEGWIVPHRQDYDTDIQYIANTRVSIKGWAFALKRMSDGTRRLVIYARDDGGIQVGDAPLSGDLAAWADTWRHVALVYDAAAGDQAQGVWRCYLAGELHGAATNGHARSGTTASEYFHLAGRVGNGSTFCGYLDCWRVSQAALAPHQFLNATEGAAAATDVLALWPLNSADGIYIDGSDVTGVWSFGTPLTALHKVTGSTSQAVAPIPNPDASAAFRGDPAVNAGSLVFNTPAAIAKRAYLASGEYGVRDTLCYTNSFTLEGWFYRTQNPGGWQLLFASGTAPSFSTGGMSLNFTYRTTGYVLYAGAATLVNDVAFGSGSIDTELNVWRHVALVYDVTVGKGTWSLYVDGTLKGSIENNTVPTRSVPAYFYIGGRPWSDNAFNGAIDTVRLTRGVLAPSQFLNAAGAPPVPPAPETVAYWKLDADGGVLDASSQVEPRYSFALDAYAPLASEAQFKRFVPVPDTTPGFIGDPRTNAGSAAFDSTNYLRVQSLGIRVEMDCAFTVEGWMFWSNRAARAVQTIAGTRFDATYGWRLSLEKNGDAAAFRLFCRTPNQTPLIDATFAFDAAGLADAWHHLALTFTPRRNDTGTWELFVDGVSVGTLENIFYPAVFHQSHWFALGGQADGTDSSFDGLLDCWRVSEGARTPDTFLYLG